MPKASLVMELKLRDISVIVSESYTFDSVCEYLLIMGWLRIDEAEHE